MQKLKSSFTYDYYANGNVKQIKSGSTVKVAYEYDEFNRLISEINYAAGKKFAYTYDSAGNVLTKYTYDITNNVIAAVASDVTTYGYTNPLWRDQLTKINNRYTIEYDAAGNPVKYKDYALEWRGNRLTKFDENTFEYDINGLRLKKNDVEFCYFNDNLLAEFKKDGDKDVFVYYRYDDSGVCGMNYDGTDYYFRKNIFGDIIEVYSSIGYLVASFSYDVYGKVLTESGTMASKVPFRYRGYYYDQETRLYYLQSRYYDPATGRFISPDSIEYLDPAVIHGLNLYAYCGNNPVMNVDPDGTFLITIGASISSLIYALGALFVAALIESSLHPIEKAIKGIGAIIDSAIDSNKQDESVNEEFVTVPWELSWVYYPNILYKEKYKPKYNGARIWSKSRKEAMEKARNAGNGKPPRHDKGKRNKDGKWIPHHFHANVPESNIHYHDHFFYLFLLFFFDTDDNNYIKDLVSYGN